jgi:lysyl endopeptidase
LRDWLDPTGSDVAAIDGIEASVPQFAVDAGVQSIVSPSASYCNAASIDPSVKIRNNGSEPLTSCTISFGLVGTNLQTYDWTGNLATFESATVNLPSIAVNQGANQQFQVQISNPNNGATDGLASNNNAQVTFSVNQGEAYTLDLVTDAYPDETGITLVNTTTGTNIYAAPVGSISGPLTLNFCLAAGCYRFIIRDSYGDGICCGANGDGSYTITDGNGIVIGTGGEFTNSDTVLFCIGATSINTIWSEVAACKIYPNPANELVNVRIQSSILAEMPVYSLIDASGKLVKSGRLTQVDSQINLESLPAGLYALRIEGQTGAITRKFLLH